MKIAVLGLGYVGMTAAACLSSQGHTVLGIDPNQSKVDAVREGRSPIREPGLDELIRTSLAAGRLVAQTAVDTAIADCDVAIVCVGTPSDANGSHNMSYIVEVTRQIAEALKDVLDRPLTLIYRSTIRPGTIDELIEPLLRSLMGERARHVAVVYNPEFLRESTAIADFFSPPKIVVGTRDGNPNPHVEALNVGIEAPTFYTAFRPSEMTKFVDNSFHALKTAFANEIGRLAVALDIDAREVHRIFVADTKLNISSYYLRPGGAFGGSCLPKDVRAIQHMSRAAGQRTPILESLLGSNESHKEFLLGLVLEGMRPGARVLLIGIAFKAESDDLRESPNVDLARGLITAGADLAIFDDHVDTNALMGQNLGALSNSPFIRELLIDESEVRSTRWDIVVDTRSVAQSLSLDAERVVDINRLSLRQEASS